MIRLQESAVAGVRQIGLATVFGIRFEQSEQSSTIPPGQSVVPLLRSSSVGIHPPPTSQP